MNITTLLNEAIKNQTNFIIFSVNKNEGLLLLKKSDHITKIINNFHKEKGLITAELIHDFFNHNIPFITKNQIVELKYNNKGYSLIYELISKNNKNFNIVISIYYEENKNKSRNLIVENILREAIINPTTDYFESK